MASVNSDVVVHVDRPLGSGERERLERALGAAAEIRGARGFARAEQLLVIDFDPSSISALGVLRCFQSLGHNARLVGM